MATGPGNAAWFVQGEIEPRVGGGFRLDWDQGAITSGEVTVWEAPHRFGYVERDWAPGAPPVATEITIIGRSGNRCVVRMVHSLFTSSEDWDDQVEGFESGWPGFFAILRVYLEHYPGAHAASFIAMMPASADPLSAWLRLGEALGLAGANVGERRTASSGPEPWSGIVEHVHQDAASLGGSAGSNVSLCRYFYGDDAAALVPESEARWRDWLTRTFDTRS